MDRKFREEGKDIEELANEFWSNSFVCSWKGMKDRIRERGWVRARKYIVS